MDISPDIAVQLGISALVLASVWQAGNHRVSAWPLLIAGQGLFLAYAVHTGQLGFPLLNLGMIAIGIRNWVAWSKAAHRV